MNLVKQYLDRRIKTSTGLEIHKVSNYVLDIFIGEGWQQQSRYSLMKGRWTHTGGKLLSATKLKEALQCL